MGSCELRLYGQSSKMAGDDGLYGQSWIMGLCGLRLYGQSQLVRQIVLLKVFEIRTENV